jgi:hypothetical protein
MGVLEYTKKPAQIPAVVTSPAVEDTKVLNMRVKDQNFQESRKVQDLLAQVSFQFLTKCR